VRERPQHGQGTRNKEIDDQPHDNRGHQPAPCDAPATARQFHVTPAERLLRGEAEPKSDESQWKEAQDGRERRPHQIRPRCALRFV